MTSHFVLAFGGTGARCAEALAYLCAANVVRTPLHVLLIDPDQANGNVDQVRNQLSRYSRVQRHVTSHVKGDSFFSTKLNEGLTEDSFFWQYPNANQTFATLLQYASHPQKYQACLELLYDDDDLSLSFERGYIGRAHVGSLDLLRTLGRAIEAAAADALSPQDPLQVFFRSLRSAAQGPTGARLIVCGSVFGGTGASGIPAIPPLLKQHLPSGLFNRLGLACVQMTPYFSFPPGQSGSPDSVLHPLATQAALYHYAYTDVGYNQIYLLGAPTRTSTNESNLLGGAGQRNRAHYAELGAALAVNHFVTEAVPASGSSEMLASGASIVHWEQLPTAESLRCQKLLAAFATFCYLHVNFLHQDLRQRYHEEARWSAVLTREAAQSLGGQEAELKDLNDQGHRFLNWAQELHASPSVDLFQIPGQATATGLASLVRGGPTEPGMTDPYHELMAELSRVQGLQQQSPIGWYIDALSRSSLRFCEQNYPSWWK